MASELFQNFQLPVSRINLSGGMRQLKKRHTATNRVIQNRLLSICTEDTGVVSENGVE